MIALAVLWGTLSAFVPLDSCGTQMTAFPEPGIRQIWIRVKDWGAAEWRDTLRYSVPANFAHGGSLPIPYVHRCYPQFAQVSAVDSAGNVSCWSNTAVMQRSCWP